MSSLGGDSAGRSPSPEAAGAHVHAQFPQQTPPPTDHERGGHKGEKERGEEVTETILEDSSQVQYIELSVLSTVKLR